MAKICYICTVIITVEIVNLKISEAKFAGSSTRVAGRPRRHLPEFAFIGRSNVGKSSLINMLCDNSRLAMTSATPGKTKLVNHFLINDSWYLVDLPGYGYAKTDKKGKEEIAEVIKDYITGSEDLACLFVLIDSRHDIGHIDIDFISELGEHGIPRNAAILSEQWEQLPVVLCSSSQTKKGKEEILSYINSILTNIKE